MYSLKKSVIALLICSVIICSSFFMVSANQTSEVNAFEKHSFNIYDADSTIPDFFLYEHNDNIILVVENPYTQEISATTYTKDFKMISQKSIIAQGNYFGGFYSGLTYNYMVFGQRNDEEDINKETFRIVKYDKDFNCLDTTSILGSQCETWMPFDAGYCRMSEFGNELTVHTCREWFRSSDGLRHQGQFTIVINTETMTVTNKLGFFQDNHVSHSFNQFVRYDNGKRVLVDHGDAYPRSLYLQRYEGEDDFDEKYTGVNLFNFTGEIGDNYTGAITYGFEVSENNYIAAITTVDQNDKVSSTQKCSDVVLLICDKENLSDKNVKQVYLTNHIPENKRTGYVSLVKLSENRFAVLWEECENFNYFDDRKINGVNFVIVDEDGNKLIPVKTFKNLELSSQSQPLYTNGKLVWCYQNRDNGDNANLISLDIRSYLNCKHNIIRINAKIESCSNLGNKVYYKCKNCGEIYDDANGINKTTLEQVLKPMRPHQGGKATCQQTGKCTVCGTVYISRTEHAYGDWVVTEEPTCTSKGMKWQYCKDCESGIGIYIPAAHTVTDYSVVTAPTCTKDGVGKGECIICGIITECIIPATGHTESGKWITKYEPTCIKWGSRKMNCSSCNALIKEEPLAPTGHTLDEWKILTPATCQTEGIRAKKCTICQHFPIKESTSISEHSMKWVVVTPATCQQEGKQQNACEFCGVIAEEKTISTTSHSFGEWEVTKQPTVTEKGIETRTCSCGKTETREIPKLDKPNEEPEPPKNTVSGDVNGDENITAVDARLVLQFVAGLRNLNESESKNADMNGDSVITAVDARIILQIVAGLR